MLQNPDVRIECTEAQKLSVELSAYQEQYFTVVDKKIEQLNLKLGEQEVLDCYMAGMRFMEISKFLEVDSSTVYRRRQKIQIKYKALFD